MEEKTHDYRTDRSFCHHDHRKPVPDRCRSASGGAQQGLGAIEGGSDTFFGKGKASASDRIFARLTSIVGVIFVIAAIVLNIVH